MKKLLSLLIALCMCFFMFGCGVYTPPADADNDKPSDPGIEAPAEYGPDAYTVTLKSDGKPFVPSTPVRVCWKNDVSVFTAAVGADGVAGKDGLDGSYSVTLLDLPTGYTYDPNENYTDNIRRNISIEIYKYTIPAESGRELYNEIININAVGTYRATISRDINSEMTVYFQLNMGTGLYRIESLVDTSADTLNPIMDVYNGSSAYKTFDRVVDGGGKEGLFTKNFKVEADSFIAFGIRFESRVDVSYPVHIFFRVKDIGNSPEDGSIGGVFYGEKIEHEEVFKKAPLPAGTAEYVLDSAGVCKVDHTEQKAGETYHYTEYRMHSDGYYHMYDPEKKEYGPTIFACIDCGTDISDQPLSKISTMEYIDGELRWYSGSLTRVFVKEYDPVSKTYSKKTSYDYTSFIQGTYTYGSDGCIIKDKNGKPVKDPDGPVGYADYCNSDGLYPVTEELRVFLQGWAIEQAYFNDGQGWAETALGLNSSEDNMWLWACKFYKD